MMALSSVMPLMMSTLPVTVRLGKATLPRVTAFKVPVALKTRPVLLTMVPPLMVPLMLLRPPTPKMPASSMSSTVLALFKMPVTLTSPPVRLNEVTKGVVILPPRFMVPPVMLNTPVLLLLVPEMLKMPPETFRFPVLLQLVGDRVVVPVLAFKVPALVKVVGLMVSVWPATLALRVPLFRMLAL